MSYIILMASVALIVGTVIALTRAFGQDVNKAGIGSSSRKRFSIKWLGLSFLTAGSAVFLLVVVLMPVIVMERIAEAKTLTRKTFREKLGREPDTIQFDGDNLNTGWDGWKYAGSANFGNEIWDVTVTRSNDNVARKTSLLFEALPRK